MDKRFKQRKTIVILAVTNSHFHRLVVCILVLEDTCHTSSGWAVLFFFSSLFYDRPVDMEG